MRVMVGGYRSLLERAARACGEGTTRGEWDGGACEAAFAVGLAVDGDEASLRARRTEAQHSRAVLFEGIVVAIELGEGCVDAPRGVGARGGGTCFGADRLGRIGDAGGDRGRC